MKINQLNRIPHCRDLFWIGRIALYLFAQTGDLVADCAIKWCPVGAAVRGGSGIPRLMSPTNLSRRISGFLIRDTRCMGDRSGSLLDR
ncbi:MAG: hypothetical protein WAT09_15585, partial [Paracoccaceae bacterium]